MKRWLLALMIPCLVMLPLVTVPVLGDDKTDAADAPADADRPPEQFFTPDTLLMVRIDLASITGPMLKQTLNGLFNQRGRDLLMKDEFSTAMFKAGESAAAAYEKEFRNPFEAKGGSSIWVVTMSAGADAENDHVYLLIRLGQGLGMKPPENFEQWVNTKAGAEHVRGLTEWVNGLEPKRLMGSKPKPGEKKSMDFSTIVRVGQYLVCCKPGTPMPQPKDFDPTALLAFTKALYIGSRQRLAFALVPHKRWRDSVAKQLMDAQKKVDEKKAKKKPASVGDVLTAQMMLGVLNASQWIAGWVRPGAQPAAAVVVRGRTDQAAADIMDSYDKAVLATYAMAAYYDGKAALRDFLSDNRDKKAQTSYTQFAQIMIRALKVSRKGPLVGLVLETDEIQRMTEAAALWQKQQQDLTEEQRQENKRKREERRK